MKRIGRGIPAAAVLANGLSRHGAHCHCRICVDIRTEAVVEQAKAQLDTHFEKFAPAIAAINAGMKVRP